MRERKFKILIDTNVAMTFLTKRIDPFTKESEDLMFLCGAEKITIWRFTHSR